MSINFRDAWEIIKQTVQDWSDDHASSMGAALAYYTLFSLAPLLVIVIAIAGAVFGADAARGEIMGQLEGLMGPEAARAIEALLASTGDKAQSTIASIVGFATLLIGATTVFAELQTDLDRIWRVDPPQRSGLWNFLHERLLSFGMVLTIGFLLIVSLVVSAVLAALSKYWEGLLANGMGLLMHAVDFLVSFGLLTLLFAMIYKILPRARIAWRDVWIGAAITSLLFGVGKLLIGLYIGTTGVASSYGAAGTVVVILLWVYYSAQIFLLGAEFTKIYAHRHGSRTARRPVRESAERGHGRAAASPGSGTRPP